MPTLAAEDEAPAGSGIGETSRRVARWVALAWLISLPVQAWPLAMLRGQPLMVPDAILAGAWMATLVALVAARGRAVRGVVPLLAAGAAFLGALLLSALLGGRPASSLLKLMAFAPMVLAPAMLRWLFDDRAQAMRALKAFAAGCVIAVGVGLVGLVDFYLQRDVAEQHFMCGYGALHRSPTYPRLCAPFRNFNMFCSYLVATVPLGVGFVSEKRGRCAGLAVAGLASVVALFTLSAGVGAFALVLAFAIAPLFGDGGAGRLLRLVAWVGAILVEVAFVLASFGTLAPSGSGTLALGSRDYLWWDGSRPSILAAGFRTWSEHPIFGLGYGSSVARVTDPRAYVPADQIDIGRFPPFADMEAHNLVLSVAGQAGLLGLVTFACLLVVLVAPLLRVRLEAPRDHLRQVVLASIVGVVLVHGFFIAVEEARHFWPLLAMGPLVALLRRGARRPAVEPQPA